MNLLELHLRHLDLIYYVSFAQTAINAIRFLGLMQAAQVKWTTQTTLNLGFL